MARSSYIYLLSRHLWSRDPGQPVTAFTVKHEMISWLDRNRDEWDSLRIFRVADGRDAAITELNVEELMEGN
jgi:hypothetical protein